MFRFYGMHCQVAWLADGFKNDNDNNNNTNNNNDDDDDNNDYNDNSKLNYHCYSIITYNLH